jgi:hypothetical protein
MARAADPLREILASYQARHRILCRQVPLETLRQFRTIVVGIQDENADIALPAHAWE